MMRSAILLLGLVALSVGCSEQKYPVSGRVQYLDKPLPNVNVVMLRNDGSTATAVTDANGAFAAVTTEMPNDGAFAGEYKIAITPVTSVADNPESSDAYALEKGPSFPPDYMSTESSNLTVEVKPEMEPVEIVLQAK